MLENFIQNIGNSNLIVLFILLGSVIIITLITFSSEKKNNKKLEKYQPKYIENEETIEKIKEQEKAKEQLEELTISLQNPKEEIERSTDFEKEQEKTAIINYEELKKASINVDNRDKKLLEDEGNEPISIEDLYRRDLELKRAKLDLDEQLQEIEMRDYKTPSKFKNSEVLSPVFGINRYAKSLQESEFKTKVEIEIAKTERFLKELKELRNKLD